MYEIWKNDWYQKQKQFEIIPNTYIELMSMDLLQLCSHIYSQYQDPCRSQRQVFSLYGVAVICCVLNRIVDVIQTE
jgi:hypothetical protein